MQGQSDRPSVSIGLFVYNGEKSLRRSLDSLVAQSFRDFELIISDNASTDGTELICREYADADPRIVYIRQPTNIGPAGNMKFVLDEARGEYFMWAACDDIRSPEFIEVNREFLVCNPDYVASTSPNGFDVEDPSSQKLINFGLEGDTFDRFETFFRFCWVSHGIFYSLSRTSTLRKCGIVGEFWLAFDWAIDLFLASRGRVHRTEAGSTIFGVHGISRNVDTYRISRSSWVEFFWPFLHLGRYCATITTDFSFAQKLRLAAILLKLNLTVNISRLRSSMRLVSTG